MQFQPIVFVMDSSVDEITMPHYTTSWNFKTFQIHGSIGYARTVAEATIFAFRDAHILIERRGIRRFRNLDITDLQKSLIVVRAIQNLISLASQCKISFAPVDGGFWMEPVKTFTVRQILGVA